MVHTLDNFQAVHLLLDYLHHHHFGKLRRRKSKTYAMVVIDEWMTIDWRLVHPSNALFPIVVMDDGMTTDRRLVQ